MHVGGERRRRGAIGQPTLLLAHLGQVHPSTSELGWHGYVEVAGHPQVVEVLAEEAILSVVRRCTLGKTLDELIAQDLVFGQNRGGHIGSFGWIRPSLTGGGTRVIWRFTHLRTIGRNTHGTMASPCHRRATRGRQSGRDFLA